MAGDRVRLPIPKDLLLNFSAMVFLGVSLFLTWEGDYWTSLASLRGVLFILGGLLISGVMVGWPLTRLHRMYSMSLIRKDQEKISESSIKTIRFTGTVVMMLQLLVVYYATEFGFSNWVITN
ncbi:MAG: hypothetical protein ACR2QW_15405 [bacterium]